MESPYPSYKLTPYSLGSLREVFSLSLPLILGLFSTYLMTFMDRLLLSKFSLDAMTALATAIQGFYAIIMLPMDISGITDVFSGQLHGKNAKEWIAKPVWQMIWFSIFLSPLFIFSSLFLPHFLFSPEDLENSCFSIILSFGSFFCLAQALIGYFTSQGRSGIVFVATILGNLLNILLDLLLIFGYGPVPSLGAKGAAIATVTAQIFIVSFLLAYFLKAKERKEWGKKVWKIDWKLLTKCFRIGFPSSLAHTSEFFCYFIFYLMMKSLGKEYLVITTLVQSLYYLVIFLIEGLWKGVTALQANFIGAKMYYFSKKNLWASLKLHGFFFLGIILFFVCFAKPLTLSFFSSEEDLAMLKNPLFSAQLMSSVKWVVFFFLLDGAGWIFVAMLTAAGDTKYIMKIGTIAPWLLYVLPPYIGVRFFHISVEQVLLFTLLYEMALFLFYFVRYFSQKWKKIELMNEIQELYAQKNSATLLYEKPSESCETTQGELPVVVYVQSGDHSHTPSKRKPF